MYGICIRAFFKNKIGIMPRLNDFIKSDQFDG